MNLKISDGYSSGESLKFIIFLSFFIYTGFAKAFIRPQGGGIPTEVICAIAAQNAMTGKDPSQEERKTEEDLRTEREEVREKIRTTTSAIKGFKTGLKELLKSKVQCQYEDNDKKEYASQRILSNLIKHIEKENSAPPSPSEECTEDNFTISLFLSEEGFVISQNLNPFFLIAPFSAQAQETALAVGETQERAEGQFCCINGNVSNISLTGTSSEQCQGEINRSSEGLSCHPANIGPASTATATSLTPTVATGGNTDGNTGGNAGGNTDGNTDGNAGGNTDGNTDGNAGGNTDGNADGNAGGNTDGNAGGNTDGNTDGNKIGSNTCSEDDQESACDYWTYKRFFDDNGYINSEFCNSSNLIKDVESNSDNCNQYLLQLKELIGQLNDLKEKERELDRQIRNAGFLNISCHNNPDQEKCGSSKTEGRTWCTSCFNETIESFYPKKSGWEKLGEYLLPAASLFFGYRGIRQNNEKLSLAGFEPDNSAYTRLAYPYALSALYGSNKGAGPCSPSMNNFGGYYSASALLSGALTGGSGFNNFFRGGMFNAGSPWGGGFNAGSPWGGGFNVGSPWGGGFNAGSPWGGGFNIGSPWGGGFNAGSPLGGGFNVGSPWGGGFNAGSPWGGGFNTGSPWGGGLNANSQFNINYQAQMEAYNRARTAYMEALQVEQERNMAKYTAMQSLQQQMYQLQNQMRRIWTGYDSGGGSFNSTTILNPGTVSPSGSFSGGITN